MDAHYKHGRRSKAFVLARRKIWADLACQKNVRILMVHHTQKNKGNSDQYPIDGVLGSQGINASFDIILVMKKAKDGQGSVLSVTGKDVVYGLIEIEANSGTEAEEILMSLSSKDLIEKSVSNSDNNERIIRFVDAGQHFQSLEKDDWDQLKENL